MQELIENHPYIQKILSLEKQYPDRKEFHSQVETILKEMGNDNEFLKQVIRRNFEDPGYLAQKWSLYNIPFFYIYETADFNLKIHFFPGMQHYVKGTAAHCIHHHNNYILTTAAIHGSGYEAMLFDKKIIMDPMTLHTQLRLNRYFSQADFPVHRVDAWEPHLVYNPESFSATLQLWTPDQKRSTDQLRTSPILKAVKTPLRKMIYMLGMEKRFGIAAKKTYQWYPSGDHFMGIDEEEYFEPTRKATGPEVNSYSMQTVFYFIQQRQLEDADLLKRMQKDTTTPPYYQSFINQVLNGEPIKETYCKETINIPQKTYNVQDVLEAVDNHAVGVI
jgi:hypothetical protein